jgi:predicted membrane protein
MMKDSTKKVFMFMSCVIGTWWLFAAITEDKQQDPGTAMFLFIFLLVGILWLLLVLNSKTSNRAVTIVASYLYFALFILAAFYMVAAWRGSGPLILAILTIGWSILNIYWTHKIEWGNSIPIKLGSQDRPIFEHRHDFDNVPTPGQQA